MSGLRTYKIQIKLLCLCTLGTEIKINVLILVLILSSVFEVIQVINYCTTSFHHKLQWSIHLSLSIRPSIHPSYHPYMFLYIYLSIYIPIHLSIHPSISLSFSLHLFLSLSIYHPSIHSPLYLSLSPNLKVYPSLHFSIYFYPSIYNSIYPSISLSIHQSNTNPSIHPLTTQPSIHSIPTHSFIHSFICPSVHLCLFAMTYFAMFSNFLHYSEWIFSCSVFLLFLHYPFPESSCVSSWIQLNQYLTLCLGRHSAKYYIQFTHRNKQLSSGYYIITQNKNSHGKLAADCKHGDDLHLHGKITPQPPCQSCPFSFG